MELLVLLYPNDTSLQMSRALFVRHTAVAHCLEEARIEIAQVAYEAIVSACFVLQQWI